MLRRPGSDAGDVLEVEGIRCGEGRGDAVEPSFVREGNRGSFGGVGVRGQRDRSIRRGDELTGLDRVAEQARNSAGVEAVVQRRERDPQRGQVLLGGGVIGHRSEQ